MTSDDEVVRLLRQAIDRVGVPSLARRSGLARNVLGDMLPEDPLAVSLLSAAAEQGVVQRLTEQSDDDLAIVGPRLADGLASGRGLVPDQARWAVDTWAAALGRAPASSIPTPQVTEPGPTAPMMQEQEAPSATEQTPPADTPTRRPAAAVTRRAPAKEEPAAPVPSAAAPPAAVPPAAVPPAAVPPAAVTPAVPAAPVQPAEVPRRRRRGLLLAVAAGVVVLLVVAGVVVLGFGTKTTAADAWARSAVVEPKGQGVDATVAHDMSQPLGTKAVRLRNGDQVEVKSGPVEVRLGASVVRLDDRTTLAYTAATSSAPPLLAVSTGQVWLNVANGQHIGLRSSSGDHANLTSGRFVATCANTCSYETLDESQVVHSGDYAYTMTAHQRFTPSAASSQSMGSQMDMSTPSASASTSAGSGMSMSTPDPNLPKPETVAPDILRNSPWVQTNVALDKAQHRSHLQVAGRSLLGTWTLMLQRPDVPAEVHRVVTFSASHCATATCVLTATTTTIGPSGAQQQVKGTVEVDDAAGDLVKIDYDPTQVACRTAGKADGTQQIVDNLAFAKTGNGGSGSRVATYTPGGGSPCTSQQDRQVQAATIDIAAHSDITGRDLFTSPGATESLVLGHIHGAQGSCSPNRQAVTGETADAVCRPPSATGQGPHTIAYYSFGSAAALDAAYAAQVAGSKQASNAGNCDQGSCERPTADGRRLIYGDAYLVETDRSSLMMIVATGSVRSQLAHWRPTQQDFSFAALPIRGF